MGCCQRSWQPPGSVWVAGRHGRSRYPPQSCVQLVPGIRGTLPWIHYSPAPHTLTQVTDLTLASSRPQRPFFHVTTIALSPISALWRAHIECVIACPTSLYPPGVSVNFKNEFGETPLHLSSVGGHPDLVLELLRRGADANAATAGVYEGTFSGEGWECRGLRMKGNSTRGKTEPTYIVRLAYGITCVHAMVCNIYLA